MTEKSPTGVAITLAEIAWRNLASFRIWPLPEPPATRAPLLIIDGDGSDIPAAAPGAPIEDRIAVLMVFVWDSQDSTTKGRLLEDAGRLLGPEVAGHTYRVSWILAGPRATPDALEQAVQRLTDRGYVIDIFAAVHGDPDKPFALSGGESWIPDLGTRLDSVRLIYSTACFGAAGEAGFRARGAKTYIASSATNYVNSFHMIQFFRYWRGGETADDACDLTNRPLEEVTGFGLNRIANWICKLQTGSCPSPGEGGVIGGTTPRVFGDPEITIASELPPAAPGPGTGELAY